jgi:hypothetical protein
LRLNAPASFLLGYEQQSLLHAISLHSKPHLQGLLIVDETLSGETPVEMTEAFVSCAITSVSVTEREGSVMMAWLGYVIVILQPGISPLLLSLKSQALSLAL